MSTRKSQNSKPGADKPRAKSQVKQSHSQRIKGDNSRPHCGIQWNDVKTGLKHFKIKRWNSIGSWVVSLLFRSRIVSSKLDKLQRHSILKRKILLSHLQSPDSGGGTIDLTNFDVTDGNYTKRKNVFRLSSSHYPAACDNECELLLQTQSQQDMTDWMSCLKAVSRSDVKSDAVSGLRIILKSKLFYRNISRNVKRTLELRKRSHSEWQP